MATSLFGSPPVARTGDLAHIQAQINQRGLTREQAKERYGLGDDMVDWLGQRGLSFPTGGGLMNAPTMHTMAAQPATVAGMPEQSQRPAQPPGLAIAAQNATAPAQPALAAAADMGRNGDTQIAHVSPGEIVVPKEMAAVRPDVVANVQNAIAGIGGDPRSYTVGSGRRNPITGAQEFATSDEINAWLAAHPTATDAEIRAAMDQNGVTTQDMATATGSDLTSIQQRYDAAGVPVAAPAPNPISYSAVTTPAPITAAGYSASGAKAAPNVVAGQGTAENYDATLASAAPNVSAGTAVGGQATSQGYTSTDATASLWNPDARSTVQDQLRGIVAEDSPLNQLAETRSLQEMNRKGLANSSMAVQAGQTALYDRALPIAQQDAAMYAASGQFNAGAQTNVNLANAAGKNQAAAFTANAANDTSKFNVDLAAKMSMFNVDEALKAGIVNQDQANKMAALNAQMINRADEFNITTNAQMAQFNISAALQAGIVNQQQANQMSMFNAQQANQAGQFNAAQTNQLAQFNTGLAAQVAQFNASESNDLLALGMDSQTRLSLANIEANYRTLMQTSASGADLYKTSIASISQILQNTDLDAAAKSTAIGNITGMLNGSLDLIGTIGNLDLPELNFSYSTMPTSGLDAGTGTYTASTGAGLYDAGSAGPGTGSPP
jgi:hypothetical protein